MNSKYVYGFIILSGIFVSSLTIYFASIGYDTYEAKEKTVGIVWIIGILGYIGLKIHYFIKERK